MAHTWSFASLLVGVAGAAVLLWLIARRRFWRDTVAVRLRLDRSAPGAHLMWEIANVGAAAITVTKLIIRTARPFRSDRDSGQTVPLGVAHVLEPGEHVLIPTDVDWTLLSARAMAVVDRDGREHAVSRAQLAAIQDKLRMLIDRRDYNASATDWLYGATNLAFGVVILGLGFFMLMWVIATG